MSEVVLETRDLVKHFPLTRGIVFKTKYGDVRAVARLHHRQAASGRPHLEVRRPDDGRRGAD